MPAPGGVNANIFAMLDSGSDDEAPAPKQQAKKAQPKAAEEVQKPKERKQGKGGDRQGKGERDDRAYGGEDKPSKPSDTEGRKGGNRRREDGGDKGKGKGSGRKGGPREFDRRSQDGRKGGKGEAREGRGKYNWGEKTDYKPDGAAPADGAAAADGAEAAAPAEVAEPEPVEEEEVTMGLDEYMAQQKAANAAALPQLGAARKVAAAPADGVEFHRDQGGTEDDKFGMIFSDYNGKRTKGDGKEEKEGWVNADNVLNLKFADKQQEDRGKGGKGKGGDRDDDRPTRFVPQKEKGGKGGKGGKPAGRGKQGPGFSTGLDDNSAFPSLG